MFIDNSSRGLALRGDVTKESAVLEDVNTSRAELTLDMLREEIDDIDQHIVELLKQRFAMSLAVGRLKMETNSEVYVPWREELILSKLKASCDESNKAEALGQIYQAIFASSRELQKKESANKGGKRLP